MPEHGKEQSPTHASEAGKETQRQRAEKEWPIPALPAWEMAGCWLLLAVILISVFVEPYRLSVQLLADRADNKSVPRIGYGRYPITNTRHPRDNSDFEWMQMYHIFPYILALMGAHSLGWNLLHRFVSRERLRKRLYILYSTALVACILHPLELGLLWLEGVLIFAVALVFRRSLVIFLVAAVYHNLNIKFRYPYKLRFFDSVYRHYTLFSFISFCCKELIQSPTAGKGTLEKAEDFAFYVSYLPYQFYIIMPYRHFQRRLQYYVTEFLCLYTYTEPIMHRMNKSPVMPSRFTLVCCNILLVIKFVIKYNVIWGALNVFVHLDRMQPLPPPICPGRVALYSTIWREYDRGLYLFIKDEVYKPICQPTFSLLRKLLAGGLVFTVVLVWHKVTVNIATWIGMNIAVLLLRASAVALYEQNQSNIWTRLVRTELPLLLVSFIALHFFDNLFNAKWSDWTPYLILIHDFMLHPGLPTLYMTICFYAFINGCMETSRLMQEKSLLLTNKTK